MNGCLIVDAGCRLGPPSAWEKIGAEVIGFDPDPDECARLGEIHPNHTFIPLALDIESNSRNFWITENSECGSFYRPDQTLLSNGFAGHRIVGQKEVPTVDLDSWMEVNRPGRSVDLLKLDTQGSELDILKGSIKTIGKTLWIVVEVEFHPLYEGQPLFSDVDLFLRQYGFNLWNFGDVNCRHGQMIWADAYYFKPPLEGKTLELGRMIQCPNL
ncbi:MAG TPA: FkbM family methyltransferase [Terriglobia bacterium]|nr:FkbM family methyltransferase [Terriglobia bacterium]